MKCSFIVSAYDRPAQLACLLRCLQAQTEKDFEVIVTDNWPNAWGTSLVEVARLCDDRFRYVHAADPDCYYSANRGAALARGEYLCFPSDDGLYVARFLERMLRAGTDLIYCDCVYDGHGFDYAPFCVQPITQKIDKGGFLIRRSKFPGFAGPPGYSREADGWMIEQAVNDGVSHAKVPGYMWIHS